jgi:hypothetical protein
VVQAALVWLVWQMVNATVTIGVAWLDLLSEWIQRRGS